MNSSRTLLRRVPAWAVILMAGCGSPVSWTSPFDPGSNPSLSGQTPRAHAPAKVLPDSPVDPANLSGSEDLTPFAARILRLDAAVKPVTEEMFRKLNAVLEEACTAIRKLDSMGNGNSHRDRRQAEARFRAVDAVLIQHGFLYPEDRAVDLLADALVPFRMEAGQRQAFEAQPENQRRLAMVAERFPGPFHRLDCDTACFLYLAVAERLKLPWHLVFIPSHDRKPGHTFVRWREGSRSLNWETMNGVVRTDESYVEEWRIQPAEIREKCALADLSMREALGCARYLLAVQYERRNQPEAALRECALALEMFPGNLDARRQFAWLTATAPGLRVRDHDAAITHARFAARLAGDADSQDTLAAAYASAGRFDLAVKAEGAAIAISTGTEASLAGYRHRLALYRQQKAYRQPADAP